MTNFGICLDTFLPMRIAASSSSELINCLVFGESYNVIENQEEWYYISSDYDNYKGFISASNFHCFNKTISFKLINSNTSIYSFQLKTNIKLGPGSALPDVLNFEIDGLKFKNFNIGASNILTKPENTILDLVNCFIGVPYLWGGKSIFGIDCSGLTQMIYKALGKFIPRDSGAQEQFLKKEISFELLTTGDLVFFHQKMKIVHVGIYLGDRKIAHSAGNVHIDTLTKEGIVDYKGRLTHHFLIAKRLE